MSLHQSLNTIFEIVKEAEFVKKLQSIRLLLGVTLLLPGLVQAENTLQPYASITMVQDSNIYRLDSNIDEASLPSTLSKSDTIYQTAVGLNVDWTLSRQQFLINASMTDSRFDKNESLDNTGQNLSATWNWLVGSRFKGRIGVNHNIALSDFANSIDLQASQKTADSLFANANWHFHPDWQVGYGINDYNVSYDKKTQALLERQDQTHSLNLDYLVSSGSRVGLKYSQLDSHIPVSSGFDNQYTQSSYLVTTLWNVTGKSNLSAEVGLVNRDYQNVNQSGYNGLDMNVAYDLKATGKLAFKLGASRGVSASDDVYGTDRVTTGVSLGANWSVSEKVSINGRVNHQIGDFINTDLINNIPAGYTETNDSISLGLGYKPHRKIDIGLNYSKSRRDSDINFRDYRSDKLSLSLAIKL